MRIAINAQLLCFDRTFRSAGTSVFIYQLIKSLIEIDHTNQYYIFMGRSNWKPELFALRENVKVFFSRLDMKNPYVRIFWENVVFPFLLWLYKIDVFHSVIHSVPLVCPVKKIITIHDLSPWVTPSMHQSQRNWYLKYFVMRSVRNANAILTSSENTKKDVSEILKIPEERIKVVYLAANEKLRPVKNGWLTREKYHLPSIYFLQLCTLEPRKNTARVIDAFSIFSQRRRDVVLVIAGPEGWMFGDIKKKVNDLNLQGRVVFPGFINGDDLAALYSCAKLFVYPSLYEGFGIPVLEAMRCGCPVVTSNVSSLPEVAGDAALLVDPTSVNEIAQAMESLLGDDGLRDEMIRKGFAQAEKFSWEKMARETLSVYEKVYRAE